MKIALTHEGTNYWLAGEPEVTQSVHSSAGDVSINGEITVQPQARLRAASMAFRDRRNLQQIIAFSSTRKFETTGEAETYAATYDAVMPRTGYLDFYNEAGEAFARMVNAVVLPPERVLTGVSLRLSYQVYGGQILVPDGEGDFVTPEITMGGEAVTMGG